MNKGIVLMGRTVTIKKLFFLIMGMAFVALGIALFVKAEVGAEPWTLFYAGVSKALNIKLGYVTQGTGLIIVIFVLLIDRVKPHIGTILSFVLIGIYVNIFMNIDMSFLGHGILSKYLILFIAVISMSFGIGLYVTTELGEGPIELLQFFIARKTGKSISKVRVIMDITVSIIGFILGGPLGVGTVISALTMGPLISFFIGICKKF